MLYTKEVMRIEEQTMKSIEDFIDFGDDYNEPDEDEELEVEEENTEPEVRNTKGNYVYSSYEL